MSPYYLSLSMAYFSPINNNDDWSDMKKLGADSKQIGKLDIYSYTGGEYYFDYVGKGDSVDYFEFKVDSKLAWYGSINPMEKVKFGIYQLQSKKGKHSLKKLYFTNATPDSEGGEFGVVLSQGTYYLGIESLNAPKNGTAHYEITPSIYDGKSLLALNDTWKQVKGEQAVEGDGANFEGVVGNGNKADFMKFHVSEEGSLKISSENYGISELLGFCKVTCLNEKGKNVALAKVEKTYIDEYGYDFKYWSDIVSKKTLAAGDYYLGISSSDKKTLHEYNVTLSIV